MVVFIEEILDGLKRIGVIGDLTEQNPILNEHGLPFILRVILLQVTVQIGDFIRNTLYTCIDNIFNTSKGIWYNFMPHFN